MFYQQLRYPLAQPSWHWKLPIMNKYVRLLRKPSLEISHRVSNLGLPRWHSCKESACQCRRCQKPGLGRSPGGGHGHPFQFSCLENPMDRGAKQASPWSSKQSDMTEWLRAHTHTHTHTHTLLSKIIVAVAFCCSEELNMTLLPCVPSHMLGAGTVECDAHFLHLHTWNTFMNHFIFLLAFYLNTEYSTLHSILIILLLANSQIFSAE